MSDLPSPPPRLAIQITDEAGHLRPRKELMIGTAEPLHVAGDVYQDEQKRARDKGEALAFLWMTASDKRLTDAQKLTAFRATLKRFGFNTPEPQP